MFDLEYLRSFRLYEIAVFDLIVSYVGIYLLSPLLIKLFRLIKIETTKVQWLWLTLPLSVMIHLLVGQETALIKMLFDAQDYHLAKLIVLGMTIKGFWKKDSNYY